MKLKSYLTFFGYLPTADVVDFDVRTSGENSMRDGMSDNASSSLKNTYTKYK
ncbi:4799_t:CDS:2 [Gigaspora margarita]|uniref:4798_t:CDS:1 n=1 Tax=Gigaspora margarita TaxID=4874 RepID=A0ABN7UMN0_GIGMA|nr:4798_t:CDS:2 [Gigaspora margarita]CAG8614125.1 4799_t:CDS:2 [Gigaspora margarita]